MKHINPAAETAQLSFGHLLLDADKVNHRASIQRRYGDLPRTMEEALPYYRSILERHHVAMLEGDIKAAMKLRHNAEGLAVGLNDGEPGFLAGPDAPGCMLARMTAASKGEVPIWGQTGRFQIEVGGINVRIDLDGIFGIGSRFCSWMNFSAHVVYRTKPFISETGYRSFMGIHAALMPGLTPDQFAAQVIAAHIKGELRGKLVPLDPKWRGSKEEDDV